MAIQVRRGNEVDFDAAKMLPGEWAVSLDTRYVRMCFAPGVVLRMATYESFEADRAQIQSILAECKNIQSAIQRIQSEVNAKASLTIEYANAAEKSAKNAKQSEEKAKMYAENAEAVTGVGIASQTKAGIIKGGDNHIAEDGTLTLTIETMAKKLENSRGGGIKVIEIGGKTEQRTTTGAQLFDADNPTLNATLDYGNVSHNENYNLYAIPVTVGESYTMSKSAFTNGAYIGFYGEIPSIGVTLTDRNLITTTEKLTVIATDNYLCLMFSKSDNINTVMLNKGTEALTWEPYTGNKPSPSPEYPQEIKKVVLSGAKSVGKNLFNYSEFLANNYSITIPVIGGKVIYRNGYLGNLKGWTIHNAEGETLGSFEDYKFNAGIPFVLPSEARYIVAKDKLTTNELYIGYDSDTTYEPYQESPITFTNPITLNGIGDVKDRIVRKYGVWGIERKFAEVDLSTLSWIYLTSGATRFESATLNNLVKSVTNGVANMLCTNYTVGTGTQVYTGQAQICISNVDLWVYDNRYTDTDVFKNAVSGVMLTYELAEPTFEPLPTADQIALNSLLSFDGTTYLYFDSEIEPTSLLEYGTSRVGALTLESWNKAENSRIKTEELTTALLMMNQG